jgi:hypothetical protein
VLFGSGVALLSWLLEVFGEHTVPALQMAVLFVLSVALLLAYWLARDAGAVPAAAPGRVQGAHVPHLGAGRLRHAAGHRRPAVPAAAAVPARAGPAGVGVGPADDAGGGGGDVHEAAVVVAAAPLRLSPGADRQHRADRDAASRRIR